VLVLDSHDTTSPDSAELIVVVVLALECLGHTIEVSQVFLANFGDSNACGGLQVAKFSKVGFSTKETVGDTLLSAKSWEEDDHFDWVNVVSNDDELGLVFFHKRGHMVESKLEVDWLGCLTTATLSFFLQTFLLVLLGLWAVFGEQFKELVRLVLVNGVSELIDGGRHLQSLHQDSLLPLDSDVPWPFDETGEVSLWLNVTSESEVLGSFLEERSLTNVITASWGTSLGLNDLLSLSCFLNLQQYRDR